MRSVSSMEPDGMTRAWPMAPLISRKTRPTQNHAMISRRIFCSVVSFGCGFLVDLSVTNHRRGFSALKQMKETSPTNFGRMNDGVGISGDAVENFAGAPGFMGCINGHINHDRRADNVVTRNAPDEAAIQGIFAIVAHHKETVFWNGVREQCRLPGGLLNELQR